MTVGEGLLLGIVQGLTEFIPVSSSGHLVVAQHALGLPSSLTFEMLINLGTLLALIVYFWRRLVDITVRIVTGRDFRLARNIVFSAIPVAIVGFTFADFFAAPFIQNPITVAIMLVLLGLIMIFLDKLPKLSLLSSPDHLTPRRALFIGAGQVLSLIPGTSRSGSTIVASRIAGLTYKDAAEYSFLLSIPVMTGVLLKGFMDGEGQAFIATQTDVFIVSTLAAFLSGLFAVGFMIRFLQRGNLKIFGYYRLALAIVIIATLLLV